MADIDRLLNGFTKTDIFRELQIERDLYLSEIRNTNGISLPVETISPINPSNNQIPITSNAVLDFSTPSTPGTYGGVKPHVAKAGDIIKKTFGVKNIGGVGERGHVSDHPSGHALDVMIGTDLALGDRVATFAMKNSAALGIKYIIWRQQINSGRSRWRLLEDRHSVNENHFNHVHISFTNSVPGITLPVIPFKLYNPPSAR